MDLKLSFHLEIIFFQLVSLILIAPIGFIFGDFEIFKSIFVGGVVFFIVFLFYYLYTLSDYTKTSTTVFINKIKIAVAMKFILTVSLFVFVYRHFEIDLVSVFVTFIFLYIENLVILGFVYTNNL
jgi:F0F1-type ATP synthase assembly protein I